MTCHTTGALSYKNVALMIIFVQVCKCNNMTVVMYINKEGEPGVSVSAKRFKLLRRCEARDINQAGNTLQSTQGSDGCPLLEKYPDPRSGEGKRIISRVPPPSVSQLSMFRGSACKLLSWKYPVVDLMFNVAKYMTTLYALHTHDV